MIIPRSDKSFAVTASALNVLISAGVALLTYLSLAFISARFGSDSGSDAYFFLFSLTSVASTLITSFLAVAVIPAFVGIRIHDGLATAREYASGVMRASILIAAVLSIVAFLFHDWFIQVVSRFPVEKIQASYSTLILFSPIFFLSVVGEFFRIILLAMSRYTWAAACALIQPALLVLFAIYSPERSSEAVLAIALLIGKGVIAILSIALVRYGCSIRLSLLGDPISAMRQTFRVAGVYGCANFVTAISAFYFDFMASGLAAGVLTSVSLAQRISTLPITVIVNPILEIARVKFAIAQADSNTQLFSKQHQELTKLIVYLTVPIAAFMCIFSSEIITTLFQRGAFQANSVSISSYCLEVFALAIPFVSIFMLNGRAVESYQRLLWPSVLGTFGHLVMMTATFILVNQWGYLGIPYARVCVEIFYFSTFGFLALKYFMKSLAIRNLINSVSVALIATGLPVMLIILFSLRDFITLFSSRWLMLIAISVIFFSLCAILLLVLDSRIRALLLHIKDHP